MFLTRRTLRPSLRLSSSTFFFSSDLKKEEEEKRARGVGLGSKPGQIKDPLQGIKPLDKVHKIHAQEDIFNVPNTLTMARMLATPGLAYLIHAGMHREAIVACFSFGVLDWFDGWYARKYGQITVFGSFLDPLADKLFVGTLLGVLAFDQGVVPMWLFGLVVGRDVALFTGTCIYR